MPYAIPYFRTFYVCKQSHYPGSDRKNAQYLRDQYQKPEQEDAYREQELPEDFEDGKFNFIL